MDTCPHCGSALTSTVDAFCPECRNALDEPPRLPPSPEQQRAARTAGQTSLFWVLGFLALIGGAVELATRGVASFGAALPGGILLVAGGALIAEAGRRSAQERKLEQSRSQSQDRGES